MSQRFDQAYKVKKNDNLARSDFWNRILQDLDLRLDAREQDATAIQDAIDSMVALGLSRLNDTFTPLILEAQQRLANFGVLFSATSSSELTIGTGEMSLVIDAENRSDYVYVDYIGVRSTESPGSGMTAQVISYNRSSGILTFNSVLADGSGTYSSWRVSPSTEPDLSHSTRTDNPHQTSASQVGAYTTAQTDALLTAKAPLVSPVFTGVPQVPTATAGTTTKQAASAEFVMAAIFAALGSGNIQDTLAALITADTQRLRVDESQNLTTAQQRQAHANLSLPLIGTYVKVAGSKLPALCVWPDGRNLIRVSYPELLEALTLTVTGTSVTGNANVTGVSGDADALLDLANGATWAVEGNGLQSGTVVSSFIGTTLVLSKPVTTGVSNVSLRIFPYGNGDGSTFGTPDVRGQALFALDNNGGTAANRLTAGVSGVVSKRLGFRGGSEYAQTHTHSVYDPTHTHNLREYSGYANSNAGYPANATKPYEPYYYTFASGYDTEQNVIVPGYTGVGVYSALLGTSQNVPPALMCKVALFAGR